MRTAEKEHHVIDVAAGECLHRDGLVRDREGRVVARLASRDNPRLDVTGRLTVALDAKRHRLPLAVDAERAAATPSRPTKKRGVRKDV